MLSLRWRLTVAFVLVSLTASLLIAGLFGWQTRRHFDEFILDRYRATALPELQTFYQTHGSWAGVEQVLDGIERSDTGRITRRFATLTLFDADGNAVYTIGPNFMHPQPLLGSLLIQVDRQTVGRLVFFLLPMPNDSPEAAFLARTARAIGLGVLAATVIALALAWLLARTLTRPIRALMAATQAMMRGELGTQVTIRTPDELGELGAAFNQMSRDLARSLHLRRQMTADIAHDLRTPLSVILGYTEALHEGKFRGDPAIYAVLHDEAQHLNRLIDDLRTLSLVEAGELPQWRMPTPPQDLLTRTAVAHAVQAEQRGVRLEVAAADNLPLVEVDPERMAQVLGNLVNNALRYTPAGGVVRLAAHADGETVCLTVRDTGPGIAPEELPLIFERFYRRDKARTANGESGLGLPIAKSLVETHGGTLTAASPPGEGAMFTITLPAERISGLPSLTEQGLG